MRRRSTSALAAGRDRNELAVLSIVADSENEDLHGVAMLSLYAKKATPGLIKHL
jgi:hypothetical protein